MNIFILSLFFTGLIFLGEVNVVDSLTKERTATFCFVSDDHYIYETDERGYYFSALSLTRTHYRGLCRPNQVFEANILQVRVHNQTYLARHEYAPHVQLAMQDK